MEIRDDNKRYGLIREIIYHSPEENNPRGDFFLLEIYRDLLNLEKNSPRAERLWEEAYREHFESILPFKDAKVSIREKFKDEFGWEMTKVSYSVEIPVYYVTESALQEKITKTLFGIINHINEMRDIKGYKALPYLRNSAEILITNNKAPELFELIYRIKLQDDGLEDGKKILRVEVDEEKYSQVFNREGKENREGLRLINTHVLDALYIMTIKYFNKKVNKE